MISISTYFLQYNNYNNIFILQYLIYLIILKTQLKIKYNVIIQYLKFIFCIEKILTFI